MYVWTKLIVIISARQGSIGALWKILGPEFRIRKLIVPVMDLIFQHLSHNKLLNNYCFSESHDHLEVTVNFLYTKIYSVVVYL